MPFSPPPPKRRRSSYEREAGSHDDFKAQRPSGAGPSRATTSSIAAQDSRPLPRQIVQDNEPRPHPAWPRPGRSERASSDPEDDKRFSVSHRESDAREVRSALPSMSVAIWSKSGDIGPSLTHRSGRGSETYGPIAMSAYASRQPGRLSPRLPGLAGLRQDPSHRDGSRRPSDDDRTDAPPDVPSDASPSATAGRAPSGFLATPSSTSDAMRDTPSSSHARRYSLGEAGSGGVGGGLGGGRGGSGVGYTSATEAVARERDQAVGDGSTSSPSSSPKPSFSGAATRGTPGFAPSSAGSGDQPPGGIGSGSFAPMTKSQQPSFVAKLYSMLEDNDLQDMISWNRDGTLFNVADPVEFSRVVLPNWFKHSNWQSFVRQLNMYGFHKVNHSYQGNPPDDAQVWEFKHPCFRRGEVTLLNEIRRKTSRQKRSESQQQQARPGATPLTVAPVENTARLPDSRRNQPGTMAVASGTSHPELVPPRLAREREAALGPSHPLGRVPSPDLPRRHPLPTGFAAADRGEALGDILHRPGTVLDSRGPGRPPPAPHPSNFALTESGREAWAGKGSRGGPSGSRAPGGGPATGPSERVVDVVGAPGYYPAHATLQGVVPPARGVVPGYPHGGFPPTDRNVASPPRAGGDPGGTAAETPAPGLKARVDELWDRVDAVIRHSAYLEENLHAALEQLRASHEREDLLTRHVHYVEARISELEDRLLMGAEGARTQPTSFRHSGGRGGATLPPMRVRSTSPPSRRIPPQPGLFPTADGGGFDGAGSVRGAGPAPDLGRPTTMEGGSGKAHPPAPRRPALPHGYRGGGRAGGGGGGGYEDDGGAGHTVSGVSPSMRHHGEYDARQSHYYPGRAP